MRFRAPESTMKNTFAQQELLPPANEAPDDVSGLLSWLIDPLPQRFMLPATGLLVLGLDWLLFSNEVVTAGLALPFTMVFGFVFGGLSSYVLQRRFGRDTRAAAMLKGALAGLFVGAPFPLAGTAFGAWVLATSGLAGLKSRVLTSALFRK
jgi:hypothetical protein